MYELRASELGRCTKASAACLLGYSPLPTPDKVQGWYDRGNEHEEECAAAMRDEFWTIDGIQHEIHLTGENWEMPGHLDGLISQELGSKPRVWEAKAPGAWAKFHDAYKRNNWSDPLAHRYAWQISVYMIATGLEALVCCLDDGVVKTFGIEVPPFTLAQIEQRVGEIIGYAEGGLPGSCSQNDWPCPVAYLHETPEVEEDPRLDALVEKYVGYGEAIKQSTARQKALQAEIKEYLVGTDRTTAASKVTFYSQTGAFRWNEDQMIADGIDSALYKIPGKSSERMKVTKRGSDEPETNSGD